MKIRVTLMTENDKPISNIGENPQEKARTAWRILCSMLNNYNLDEKITLENVEIVE